MDASDEAMKNVAQYYKTTDLRHHLILLLEPFNSKVAKMMTEQATLKKNNQEF